MASGVAHVRTVIGRGASGGRCQSCAAASKPGSEGMGSDESEMLAR